MEIAVFSDIHGNYRALKKCLEYAFERQIENFIFLGDYLGEFAYPQKTMNILHELKEKYQCFFIRGNKEDYWLNRRDNINCDWKNGNNSVYSMKYNFENLKPKDLDFFESIPISRQIDFEGLPTLMVCHGSPQNNREGLLLSKERNLKNIEECGCNYILCGHTHIQQSFIHKGKCVINPGAIGVPLHSKNGKTQFMILHSGKKAWHPEFISLDYQKEDVIGDLKESGLYDMTPYWCQITEHLIRTGEVSHSSVLEKVRKLSAAEHLDCQWYNIPEKYWEQAITELIN